MIAKVTVNFEDRRPESLLVDGATLDACEALIREDLIRQGLHFTSIQATQEAYGSHKHG